MPFAMTVRPPFTLPVIMPSIFSPVSSAFSSSSHRPPCAWPVARQARRTEAVLERLDRDAHEIARLDLDPADVVAELLYGNDAFRLQPRVHHHEVVVHADNLGGDDLAHPHLLAVEALLEQCGERLAAGGLRADLGEDFWDCGAEEMLAIKEEKTYSNRRLAPRARLNTRPPSAMATHSASVPPPVHDSLDHFVDGKCRRIEHLRIRRRNQRSDRAICIARIPLRQITGKGAQISTDPFSINCLLAPPQHALLGSLSRRS